MSCSITGLTFTVSAHTYATEWQMFTIQWVFWDCTVNVKVWQPLYMSAETAFRWPLTEGPCSLAANQLRLTLLPRALWRHRAPFTNWPSMKWLLGSKLWDLVFCWAFVLAGQFGYWHKSGGGSGAKGNIIQMPSIFRLTERRWDRDGDLFIQELREIDTGRTAGKVKLKERKRTKEWERE